MMSKKNYKKSEYLRQQLLDAGEHLFSEKGYYGTSVRNITDMAGARLASINYHFGSKENLFSAIINRHGKPLGQARLAKLRTVKIDPDRPEETLRAIVKAFAGPMFDLCTDGDPGWRNYCILVSQLAGKRTWSNTIIREEYDEVALAFIDVIAKTFPNLDDYRLHCCFQFILGTTLYVVSDNKRIDALSDGRYQSDDIKRMSEPFYDYTVGGVLAMMG